MDLAIPSSVQFSLLVPCFNGFICPAENIFSNLLSMFVISYSLFFICSSKDFILISFLLLMFWSLKFWNNRISHPSRSTKARTMILVSFERYWFLDEMISSILFVHTLLHYFHIYIMGSTRRYTKSISSSHKRFWVCKNPNS